MTGAAPREIAVDGGDAVSPSPERAVCGRRSPRRGSACSPPRRPRRTARRGQQTTACRNTFCVAGDDGARSEAILRPLSTEAICRRSVIVPFAQCPCRLIDMDALHLVDRNDVAG
jgi:hypothetical protein